MSSDQIAEAQDLSLQTAGRIAETDQESRPISSARLATPRDGASEAEGPGLPSEDALSTDAAYRIP